jgi:hypothetical protein
MNCNINSSGLYDVNSYNLIATNATVLSTLNVAGNIIGSGTALTNLNYDSITNKPSLTLFNNPITCVSSLNVSGNSNLNKLNVSGATTLNNSTTCLSLLMYYLNYEYLIY